MRRGQLLSLDAMLSMVIIILLLGTITTTSNALKGEITTVLGWYERINIGDNMLDVLTKSPGEPKNWTQNPSKVRVVGLRSERYSYALSYEKISTLIHLKNDATIIRSLANLSNGKDFQLQLFITNTTVKLSGNFPKEIFIDLSDGRNRNIQIGQGTTGNDPFDASNVTLNGASLPKDNKPYKLSAGDVLTFYALEDITVHDRTNKEDYPIPFGSYVEIQVIAQGSNFQVQWNERGLHITGQGQVRIIIEGYERNTINIQVNITEPENLTMPSYELIMINGSRITDKGIIKKSKKSSPWIEYIERKVTVETFKYEEELTLKNAQTFEWINGRLKMNVPEYAYLKVIVPATDRGRLVLVVRDGDIYKGILVEKETEDSALKAVVAAQNDVISPSFYRGNITTIEIPWNSIFGAFDTEKGSKVVTVWVYESTFTGTIEVRDLGSINTLMEPRFERSLLKLWVWDDS